MIDFEKTLYDSLSKSFYDTQKYKDVFFIFKVIWRKNQKKNLVIEFNKNLESDFN